MFKIRKMWTSDKLNLCTPRDNIIEDNDPNQDKTIKSNSYGSYY